MKTATWIRTLVVSVAVLAFTAAWSPPARAAAPLLDPIANMSISMGGCAPDTSDQAIRATDPDGDAITFTSSGPSWMTVTSDAQIGTTRTGNIHLTSPLLYPGPTTASVTATANGESSTRTFTISVTIINQGPVLNQPANMTVAEGATANQAITGSDPCGAPLSFLLGAGPPFVTVTATSGTTGNIHLAPLFSDAGTYTVVITAYNGTTSNEKFLTITVTNVNNVNRPPAFFPIANVYIPPGSQQQLGAVALDPDGDALTFSKAAGPAFMDVFSFSPTSAAISLAPSASEPIGTHSAAVTATDPGGLSDTESFRITVCSGCDQAPVMAPLANMTLAEGTTADQIISATDPDGDPLTVGSIAGTVFMTVISSPVPGEIGYIHLAPGSTDAGNYRASVGVTDGTLSDTRGFSITVLEAENRCPTANPGGPYSGRTGVPVDFDGTASSDPDGDLLLYAWDFDASDGIGTDAVGQSVSHSYAFDSTFVVTLTVRDPSCSSSATTIANIVPACPASVFNGYDVIRLGTGKPTWFAFVQPATGCYANSDVALSSFVLKYAGNQVPADPRRTGVESDRSGDGISEIRVSFSKANLRTLFAGLPNGRNQVEVSIEASLLTGGILQGTTQVDVLVSGGATAATVSPNPFNPSGTLSFTTTRVGFARVELFDVNGRLVRSILDEGSLDVGAHAVRIDGRGSRGERLASGIYYVRGVTTDEKFTKTIAILK